MAKFNLFRRRGTSRRKQNRAAMTAPAPGVRMAPPPGTWDTPGAPGPVYEAAQETFTQQKGAASYETPAQSTNEPINETAPPAPDMAQDEQGAAAQAETAQTTQFTQTETAQPEAAQDAAAQPAWDQAAQPAWDQAAQGAYAARAGMAQFPHPQAYQAPQPPWAQTGQSAQPGMLQAEAAQPAWVQASEATEPAQSFPPDPLTQILQGTGFDYDRAQDIFYSVTDPWQRRLGYCSLYDKWATLWGLVYDSEPVRFEYGGKRWLIEFWKGQYGITTGGEIGVYQSAGPDIHIPLVFRGPFYRSVSDQDALSMAFVLEKDSKQMFLRAHRRHWWLTGFILGAYNQPSTLTMRTALVFRDYGLRDAFVAALRKMGYTDKELVSDSNFVQLTIGKPRTKQPLLRYGPICWLTMWRTRTLVRLYNKVTGGLKDVDVMLLKLQTTSPHLYQLAMNLGMQKNLYKFLGSMGKYLA